MPSSFDTNPLRAGAPVVRAMPVRALYKENPFAPAMVSQEDAGRTARRGRGAGCRHSSTTSTE
jgi:hypothetical protein